MVKLTPRAARLGGRTHTVRSMTTGEILAALLRDSDGIAAELVRDLGSDPASVADRIDSLAELSESAGRGRALLEHAGGYAAMLCHSFTGSAHILLAALDEPATGAVQVLADIGLTRASAYPLIRERLGAG